MHHAHLGRYNLPLFSVVNLSNSGHLVFPLGSKKKLRSFRLNLYRVIESFTAASIIVKDCHVQGQAALQNCFGVGLPALG